MNKLKSNMATIESAEKIYLDLEMEDELSNGHSHDR